MMKQSMGTTDLKANRLLVAATMMIRNILQLPSLHNSRISNLTEHFKNKFNGAKE